MGTPGRFPLGHIELQTLEVQQDCAEHQKRPTSPGGVNKNLKVCDMEWRVTLDKMWGN